MRSQVVRPILKSSRGIADYLERSGGVAHAEAQILAHLAAHGPCSIGDLHQVFGQRRSTLTSVLDRLVARKLIVRAIRPEDRRSFRVSLTSRGRAPAAQLRTAVEQLEGAVLKRVKAGHMAGFRMLIASIEECLESTGATRRQSA